MSLLTDWRDEAYKEQDQKKANEFWNAYFIKEKAVYEKLLADIKVTEKGTLKDLAAKYDMPVKFFTGFLDGINDSLTTPNPIEEMTEDTEVSLPIDAEKLYKNMVECDADWLYKLSEWDALLTRERRKELYLEQKKSGTVRRKGKKIMPNDPCPCGSGKKYKYCCARK
jgi:uncharacterized protein